MTAAVALPSLNSSASSMIPITVVSCPMPVDSSEARKRRREMLSLQRSDKGSTPHMNLATGALNEWFPQAKKQRMMVVSSDDEGSSQSDDGSRSSTTKIAKAKPKPQMKYDPDVPMSKEEATLWRRDQRRKRNRESAAASRQRQRDRIDELEVELNVWKDRFASVQAKIQELEKSTTSTLSANVALEPVGSQSNFPCLASSPHSSKSTILESAGEGNTITSREGSQPQQQLKPEPNKMISRHA